MLHWKQINLGDFIITNKKSIGKDDKYANIEYLETGSIRRGKITNTIKITIENAPSRARRILEDEDIIYSSVRPINRHYGFFKRPKNNFVVSTGFITITCNKSIIYPLFLYHYLTQDSIVEQLDAIAEGSTSAYPCLLPSDIEALEVLLPPLPEQKAIAGVLGSLDGKIDLLQRQNATLEAMAETLFRQWFIEEAQEDWKKLPLHLLGKVICGKTPVKKNKNFWGGHIPFIKIPDMHHKIFIDRATDYLTPEGAFSQKNKFIPDGAICVSCIATVGLVALTMGTVQTNQQINSIIPNDCNLLYYLFLYLRNIKEEFVSMSSGGTAINNLNTKDFSNILIRLPPNDIINNFNSIIIYSFNKIKTNQQQIRTLEKLRDTLLPKLMSGEVRVRVDE